MDALDCPWVRLSCRGALAAHRHCRGGLASYPAVPGSVPAGSDTGRPGHHYGAGCPHRLAVGRDRWDDSSNRRHRTEHVRVRYRRAQQGLGYAVHRRALPGGWYPVPRKLVEINEVEKCQAAGLTPILLSCL